MLISSTESFSDDDFVAEEVFVSRWYKTISFKVQRSAFAASYNDNLRGVSVTEWVEWTDLAAWLGVLLWLICNQ